MEYACRYSSVFENRKDSGLGEVLNKILLYEGGSGSDDICDVYCAVIQNTIRILCLFFKRLTEVNICRNFFPFFFNLL